MSESDTATIPSARCDIVESHSKPLPDPIQLCMFTVQAFDSAYGAFQRTTEYAKNPFKYLKKQLGPDRFMERRPLLCIPEKIDKDRYGSGYHKDHFETHVANLLGKSHGLFFITGVQAQLAALKIYCTSAGNNRVAWHISSHLETAEESAFESLYGLDRRLIGGDPEENPTVEEITEVLSLQEELRPVAIVLEIPNRTLGCKTYTFDELQRISTECRKANVKLHCDGARIWEIEPYYQETAGKTFQDLGELFDSVYVSFYKGLGGAGGALLMSNESSFLDEAKVWQRRAGGNVVTLAYQIVDDERGFNESIGTFKAKWKKMDDVVREVTKATAKFKTDAGDPIVKFVPAQPTCRQLHTLFQGYTVDELYAARDRAQEKTNIQVFSRLRPKQTVDETLRMQRAGKVGHGESSNIQSASDEKRHFIEWSIIEPSLAMETDVFVEGYVALCQELLAK